MSEPTGVRHADWPRPPFNGPSPGAPNAPMCRCGHDDYCHREAYSGLPAGCDWCPCPLDFEEVRAAEDVIRGADDE